MKKNIIRIFIGLSIIALVCTAIKVVDVWTSYKYEVEGSLSDKPQDPQVKLMGIHLDDFSGWLELVMGYILLTIIFLCWLLNRESKTASKLAKQELL